ncbi:MAG: TlpA family protein disulfide reductase [Bacteriovoracaceae bacterium]|nr:TlpA family protein disulfide reductase [Bacteriovoracaceae bacterium]
MTITSKLTSITLLICLTFGYAFYEKSKIDKMQSSTGEILQVLPEFTMYNVTNNTPISSADIIRGSKKGAMVHFWGTWCAPCERELPSFIEFSRKFKDMGINFYIVAVNDDVKKVKKFLRKFKDVPQNIKFTLDPTGVTLPLFGTVKVPETYLFDNIGNHLVKFVGPQDWNLPNFYKRVVRNVEKSFSSDENSISTNQ